MMPVSGDEQIDWQNRSRNNASHLEDHNHTHDQIDNHEHGHSHGYGHKPQLQVDKDNLALLGQQTILKKQKLLDSIKITGFATID